MRIVLIFIILTVSFHANSQESKSSDNLIVVPLQRVVGIGKAVGSSMFFRKIKIEESDSFGSKVNGYIYRHDFQPIQRQYRNFLAGKIDQKQFSSYFSYYKTDSSDLNPTYFKSDISVKVIFENDGCTSITADQNNNDDFRDDVTFILPTKKSSKKGYRTYEEIPPVFKFDNIIYYESGRFLKKSAYVRIQPYYDDRKGLDLDSINPEEIFFTDHEYRLGKIKFDSSVYNIYLNSSVFNFKNDSSRTFILMVDVDKPVPINSGYLNRKLGDTVLVGNYLINPYYVSMFGDSLFIRVDKVNEQTYGFQQGYRFPNFKAETLNGKLIDIYKFKNNGYLLVDFFGSWCGPCIANFPKLKKVQEKFSRFNFQIIGIADEKDSSFTALKKLVAKEQLKWEVIIQNKQTSYEIMNMSKVHMFPTYLLISPDNKVLFECGGGEDFGELERMLEKIFAKK